MSLQTFQTDLNVSKIIVKRTNLPRSGTTRLVGGMISASRRKNTVSDSRIEMAKLTWCIESRQSSKNSKFTVMIRVLTFSPESDGK